MLPYRGFFSESLIGVFTEEIPIGIYVRRFPIDMYMGQQYVSDAGLVAG